MLDNISTEKNYLPNMVKFYRCNLENSHDFFQEEKTNIEDVETVNTHLSTLYGRSLFELANKKVLAIHLFFEFPVEKDILTENPTKYIRISKKKNVPPYF